MQKLRSKIDIFENLVSPPDLDLPKFYVQNFFWDTTAQPEASTHIKAQPDGRISQTIFGIQSCEPKREICSRNFGLAILLPRRPGRYNII